MNTSLRNQELGRYSWVPGSRAQPAPRNDDILLARPLSTIKKPRLWVDCLPVDLPHDFRPPVHDRQHLLRLLRREHRYYAGDAHLGETFYPVEILAEAKRGDLDGSRIAAGLPRQIAEFREDFGDIATGRWNPAIAITGAVLIRTLSPPN